MLTLEEASARVLACANPSSESELVVLETCPGRVLVDDIRSDSDLPAFDRSAMDGFALRAADLAALPATLRVVDEIAAGALASHRVEPGTAARIMTGAPIPDGADSVVMVEHTESVETSGDEELVRIHRPVAPRENIRFRAENVAEGEIVLPAGHRLRPIDVAILATAGVDRVAVRPRPRVSILSTGDELVEAGCVPGPGQIRNSNGPMLAAMVHEAGATVARRTSVGDEPDAIEAAIREGLDADVLLLSGGVSMGDRDHVAASLEAVGVETIFHRVAMKPGKPVLFARSGSTLVFGLPGNPVSVYIGFVLFVQPALARMAGATHVEPPYAVARAGGEFRGPEALCAFEPCRLVVRDGELHALPVRYRGSGDPHGAARGDAFVVLPPGTARVKSGDRVEVLETSRGPAPGLGDEAPDSGAFAAARRGVSE